MTSVESQITKRAFVSAIYVALYVWGFGQSGLNGASVHTR